MFLDVAVAKIYGPRDIRIDCCAIHRPEANEVLVKVSSVALSDLDVKIYVSGSDSLNRYLGENFCGVIEKFGSDFDSAESPGSLVVSLPKVTFYNLAKKWQNNSARPRDIRKITTLPAMNSGMGEYVTVAYKDLHVIPAWVGKNLRHFYSRNWAALYRPFIIACCALEAVGIYRDSQVKNKSILIVGAGEKGFLLLKALSCLGLVSGELNEKNDNLTVLHDGALTSSPYRSQLMLDHKPTGFLSWEDFQHMAHTCGGSGFDIVFDTYGSPESFQFSLRYLNCNGTYMDVSDDGVKSSLSETKWERDSEEYLSSSSSSSNDYWAEWFWKWLGNEYERQGQGPFFTMTSLREIAEAFDELTPPTGERNTLQIVVQMDGKEGGQLWSETRESQ